jgi:hypothetical protein
VHKGVARGGFLHRAFQHSRAIKTCQGLEPPVHRRGHDAAGTGAWNCSPECLNGFSHAWHVAGEDQDHVGRTCSAQGGKAGGDCRSRSRKRRVLPAREHAGWKAGRLRPYHNRLPGTDDCRERPLKEGGAVEHQGRLG